MVGNWLRMAGSSVVSNGWSSWMVRLTWMVGHATVKLAKKYCGMSTKRGFNESINVGVRPQVTMRVNKGSSNKCAGVCACFTAGDRTKNAIFSNWKIKHWWDFQGHQLGGRMCHQFGYIQTCDYQMVGKVNKINHLLLDGWRVPYYC